MTLSSMTGFARVDGRADAQVFIVEARSVNGRGLETRYKGPAGLEELERRIKDLAQARFARGQVAVSLRIVAEPQPGRREVDEGRLAALLALAERFEGRPGVAPARLDGLIALSIVADAPRTDDALAPSLEAALTAALVTALDRLKAARDAEGASLRTVLVGILADVETTLARAQGAADGQPAGLKLKFERRLRELLAEAGDYEARIMAEAAALALRSDVREELDRLRAHVASARGLLAGPGPQGRKLDFLTQEFMREANTLCSKAADPDLTAAGLQLKALIDQFREQVQNVE